ncbi:uncharacterized protein LOC116287844, partial [Actinia tenebrosa]|uniref:Poly [ADP-ribose] polymerase n=1 Tax=Actinia tenebrosa TaxID=6105 RepID=A0A6P8HCY8_ACTTE
DIGIEQLSCKPKDFSLEQLSLKPKDFSQEQLSLKPKDFSQEQLSLKPKDLGDEELSREPKDLSHEKLFSKPKDISQEQLSRKPRDISQEQLSRKPKDISQEQLSRKPKDFSQEQQSRKPKDLGDEELPRELKDLSHEKLFSKPKELGDEELSRKLKDLSHEKLFSKPKDLSQEQLSRKPKDLSHEKLSRKPKVLSHEKLFSKPKELGDEQQSRKAKELGDEELSRKPKDLGDTKRSQNPKDLNNEKVEMLPTVSIDGHEGSRPEALRANTLPASNKMEKRKPQVLPRKLKMKTKNGLKSNDDSGKRAHNNGSTGITLQNVTKTDARPQGTRYVTKQGREDHAKQCAKEDPKFEPNVMLIQGLNKSTSYETIMNFVESKTKEQVLEIVKLEDETTALIKLEKLRDFENVKEKMESRSLEGGKVTVHRVPVCSSILVHNLASNTTRDALKYFFSNPRIGGEVTSIQYEEGNEEAIVTFKDPNVMQSILMSRSQKLNDAELIVERFNPSIQEATRRQHSHPEVAVAVDKDVMEFISATHSLGELKELLKVHGFTMTYASGDSIVYFAPTKCALGISVYKIRGIKIVTDYIKKFKAIELDVDKNHWDAIIVEISKLHKEIGKEKLLVKECESSKEKVTIICREPDAKELKKKFLDKIVETQSLEAKKANKTMTMDIEKEKLSLLIMTGYQEKIHHEYVDLEFNIDKANGKVMITGPKQQCYEAKLKICQELSNFCEKKISISKSFLEIMNFEEAIRKRIEKEFLRQQIYAVFHICEGNAFLIGINKKYADKAAVLGKSLIAEEKIKANEENIHIFKAQKWIDLCNEAKQAFKVYYRINENFDTWIVGNKEDVLSAQKTLKAFIDENSSGTEIYCRSEKGVRRYILKVQKGKLVEMKNEHSLTINVVEKDYTFVIRGAKAGRAHVREALQRWADSVSRDKKKVQQPGLHKLNTNGNLDGIIRKIEDQHNCVIEKHENVPHTEGREGLKGNDKSLDTISSNESSDATSQAVYSNASASAGYKSKKCGNVTISWKPGNIVTEHVCIQVGSTMGKLYDIFVKAGGPEFSEEPIKQSKSSNNVIIDMPGNLPCNQVILLSCCEWDRVNGEAERKLRSILRECLQQASKLNAASIAFPIIGTGELGFPKSTACQIMISEVINVTCLCVPSSLSDIRFVVFDQDAELVKAFEQEFTRAFDQFHSRETSGGGIFSPLKNILRKFKLYRSSGQVSVQVVQGDLINEKTDAIVNINAADMNMHKAGALSKAVAAAAGPAVQTECTKLGQQTAGSAVTTGSGKLKAKHIIHMIPGNASVEQIQKCIENCLQTADNSNFQSISIPACGTGVLKMSAADSAQATFQAFANVCPKLKHLRQIRIVIFQSELLSAFNKKLSEREYEHLLAIKSGKPEKVDEAKTATIEFSVYGESKKVVHEAMAALTRELTEACKTMKIDDENISKLSEVQRKVLTAKANDLEVEIKFDDSIPRIEFRGNPEDIMEIYELSCKEIRDIQKSLDIISLPTEWCPMPKEDGKEKIVYLVPLVDSSAEYQKVLKLFQQTGGTGRIMKIERIQNPHLYQQYMVFKHNMDRDNDGIINERQLFHGTAKENLNDINARGFNRIFRGINGTRFGEGVYFAKKASYSHVYASPDASKHRHLYLARVLVGRYTKGNSNMKVPPKNPQTIGRFDSTANTIRPDAIIFVVYHDSQCYPEYLITYQ